MDGTRQLIINADDFGLSAGVNRGIIQTHEHGVLTSASLMVRQPAAEAAAEYARGRPQISVGLHIDLCEWTYVDGRWIALYQRVPLTDSLAVAKEIESQLKLFRRLVGSDPTHLDSHQHVHRDEPIRSVLLELAASLRVPLRSFAPKISYCGDFYGQSDKGCACPDAITAEALVRIIRRLPSGTTELGCHPGYAEDLDSIYKAERDLERRALCDPAVQTALQIEKIDLCSFRSWTGI